MDNLTRKIEALIKTEKWLLESESSGLELAILKSNRENPWFTLENIQHSLQAIAVNYLNQEELLAWLRDYEFEKKEIQKSIGIILAGNIPLVGFHDFLTTYLSGHKAQIKLSTKDQFLLPCIVNKIADFDPDITQQILFVDRIKNVDAAIATGSGNSARYFEYYFRAIPHIIRKNRSSVAVLSSAESDEELLGLGNDIFQYFGLGCRSVSALFVPQNYSFKRMMELFKDHFAHLKNHNKYCSNYEYNLACAMLENKKLIIGDDVLLFEESNFISRIACLNYMQYTNLEEVKEILNNRGDELQCVVSNIFSKEELKTQIVAFGHAQSPGLKDYADGVNTLEFLINLK